MVKLPFRRRSQAAETDALTALLADAREGRAEAREQLLERYLPFVERVASGTCKRAVSRTDDEFQIALLAMNEAIDAYQPSRGSFISFAETVMRRRLIDSFRVNRRAREVPFTAFDEEDEEGSLQNAVEVGTALRVYAEGEEAAERAQEIVLYAEELQNYGLSFQNLAEICPKHADARAAAVAVARLIAGDPELREAFLRARALPLKRLQGRVRVSRKTLERQRGYIVAVTVLLLGDYELLHAFVRNGGERP